MEADPNIRAIVPQAIKEFLAPPVVYIKNDAREAYEAVAAELEGDDEARRQVLVDSFYLLRVATLLMHPIVPAGTEKICDYLSFEFDDFFSWNYDLEDMGELCSAGEIDEGRHRIRELPPRFDFFEKHPSQYK